MKNFIKEKRFSIIIAFSALIIIILICSSYVLSRKSVLESSSVNLLSWYRP